MTTVDRLLQWKESGAISEAQHATLAALVRKERFSLFFELNALLYLGVLSLVAGLGWTFETHFASLGDAFILVVLSLMLTGSLFYCFSRAPAYSNAEIESPNFIFDYVLYLACLVLSVELGYVEFRFEFLKEFWDNYLLFSSVAFLALAYRFDNRFVLSLALSSLAGYFGFRISRFAFVSSEPLRLAGLFYGAVVITVGMFFYRQGIKRHFLETYFHIATAVILVALVSGVAADYAPKYLLALLVAAGAAVALGVRFRRFAFVVYGTVFGYIGLSLEFLRGVREFQLVLAYFVLSGTIVIGSMVALARRFGREE